MSQMPMLSEGRLLLLKGTFSPEAKTLIGRYWGSAVRLLIDEGDPSGMDAFKRLRIGGVPFETDPDVIEDIYARFDFDFQELYKP
jgi:hypothetical protein